MCHCELVGPDGPERASLPGVSVVIPAYNAGETIGRALDSVAAQTYPRVTETIVVDDGSTDNTREIVEGHRTQVRYLRQDNAGHAAARNVAVAYAHGEYIACLDADDEWLPNKIQRQLETLAAHPGVDLLTCQSIPVEVGTRGQEKRAPVVGRPSSLQQVTFRDWILRRALLWVVPCPTGWVFPRRLYLHEGGMDVSLPRGPDYEFVLRLTGKGYTVACLTERLYRYYVIPTSASHSRSGVLTRAALSIDLMRRYDPGGSGWEADLLTPNEFTEVLRLTHAGLGWALWEVGETQAAEAHHQEAARLATSTYLRLRHTLAAHWPRAFAALNRLRTACGASG
jgi:glycosyltransferase involved in cell wall biosynthesis